MEQLGPNSSHQSQELNKSPKEKGLNQFGITSIAIAFIVVLLVLGIATYFFTTSKDNPQSQKQVPTVPTAQPTSSADPTDNWKTHTNTEKGFSIKYPKGVKVEKIHSQNIPARKELDGIQLVWYESVPKNRGVLKNYISIWVENNPSNISPKQVIQNYIHQLDQNSQIDKIVGDKIQKSLKEDTVGGYVGVSATFGFDYDWIYYVLSHDNKLYYIEPFVEDIGEPEGSVVVLTEDYTSKILSTFKFTDSIAPCPSGISREIPC